MKAVAIATPLLDSTNRWNLWGCVMSQGKASVLHKGCGTGSREPQNGQRTFYCENTTEKEALVKEQEVDRKEAGNN